jgi:hypothetical protein
VVASAFICETSPFRRRFAARLNAVCKETPELLLRNLDRLDGRPDAEDDICQGEFSNIDRGGKNCRRGGVGY